MEGRGGKETGNKTVAQMNFRITKIDKYIIRKFIGTYAAAIILIIGIVIIFDISEKIDNFVEKEAPLKAIVFDYYKNFIPYFVNMFSPLFVFITVIFFTSKLAANSEIIAMLAGGISFNRLMYPYFLSALAIALLSLALGLYVIPPANKQRSAFEDKYINGRFYNSQKNIHYQTEPGTYVYVQRFNTWNNTAIKFTIEQIEGHDLKSKLSASTAVWDSTKCAWKLKNYYIREYVGDKEIISFGKEKDTVLQIDVSDFYRKQNSYETLDSRELNELIEKQRARGDKNVKYALMEKHTRYAMPFSAFILTLMGVSLSSKKRRGGIGLNLGIGIALSFSYILFLKFSQMFVHTDLLPPGIALWVPNIMYAVIAVFLYRIAPK